MLSTSVEVLQRALSTMKIGVKPKYGTWALSRLTTLRTGRIQPVLEVEKIILNEAELSASIEKRKLLNENPEVKKVSQLFALAKQFKEELVMAEKKRDENSDRVQVLLQLVKDNAADPGDVKQLRENGKLLRDQLRQASQAFHVVNDELVNLILSLPNLLDPITPAEEVEILRDVVPPEGVDHWKYPSNLRWDRIPGAGPHLEFPSGTAVWLELELATKCQKFLLENGFCETGNVDFIKRVLLEGSGLDPNQFLRIREEKPKGEGIHHASYLVGGATFPAFLALFAQSLIQDESMFPIRYFVVGRMFVKQQNRPETLQTCAVQAFVACRNDEEQQEEYLRLTTLMEKFYSENIGISFQARLLPAPRLRTYESKKISFLVPERNIVVGDLATVGDYVSKRLLCCYLDPKRSPKFMNLITGKFLNITDFLRPSRAVEKEIGAPDSVNAADKESDFDGFLLPPRVGEIEPWPSSSLIPNRPPVNAPDSSNVKPENH